MAIGTFAKVHVGAARRLAETLLPSLPERWWHTVGVAGRAVEICHVVPVDDRPALVAAAWLHDVGYAPDAVDTGFHPLDGARLLAARGWPARVCALVAHHSGARFVADRNGLAVELSGFPVELSSVSDALTYADQTTGPRGERMPITQRIGDMLRRHGPDSVNARVHHLREPYLLAVAHRVERLLEDPRG